MFSSWLCGKYRQWYLSSGHKDRIDHVGNALVRRSYLRVVVLWHLQEWLRFTRDLDHRDLSLPSTIHSPEIQKYLARRFPRGSASRFRCIRASIRIFIDTDEDGNFLLRMRAPMRPTTKLFRKCVPGYLAFLRRLRAVRERTMTMRAFQLALFTEFLESAGVSALRQIQATLIHNFLSHLKGRKAWTIRSYASTLRGFLRWAHLEGLLKRDLSPAARAVRHYRLAELPDVLTEEEVNTLLRATDRSTAVGRRDYAILLLASRYGMRASDIRRLSLDDIDWRSARIDLEQSKTGRELVLPLLPDVSAALIAYLRRGRPATSSRTIFVRHRAPFVPFSPNNNFPELMRAALQRAGLEKRDGRRGLYLLRHTLATRMLATGQPIKTIGDVLGHATTDSTLIYAKVDLPALRTVAISIREVLR